VGVDTAEVDEVLQVSNPAEDGKVLPDLMVFGAGVASLVSEAAVVVVVRTEGASQVVVAAAVVVVRTEGASQVFVAAAVGGRIGVEVVSLVLGAAAAVEGVHLALMDVVAEGTLLVWGGAVA